MTRTASIQESIQASAIAVLFTGSLTAAAQMPGAYTDLSALGVQYGCIAV